MSERAVRSAGRPDGAPEDGPGPEFSHYTLNLAAGGEFGLTQGPLQQLILRPRASDVEYAVDVTNDELRSIARRLAERRPLFQLVHEARPVTMNDYLKKPWPWCREHTREWRKAGWALTTKLKPGHFERVGFDVLPFGPGRAQDPGNCYPSVKALIDGIVDAKVIDDDDGEHVAYVNLLPFLTRAGSSGLRLTVYNEGPEVAL